MTAKKYPQKLMSFSDSAQDFENIQKEINDGWNIVSLMANGHHYLCIMEQHPKNDNDEELGVYIPPRKKIKINK